MKIFHYNNKLDIKLALVFLTTLWVLFGHKLTASADGISKIILTKSTARLIPSVFFLLIFSMKSAYSADVCEDFPDSVIYETDKAAYSAATKCAWEWVKRDVAKSPDPNEGGVYDIINAFCGRYVGPRAGVLSSSSSGLDHAGGYLAIRYKKNGGCNWSSQSISTTHTNFKYKKQCKASFDDIDNECATFCPPEKPELDLTTGECFNSKDVLEQTEECVANPVIVSTGEKYQFETDFVLNSPFPIKIQRNFRSFQSQESKYIQNKAINNHINSTLSSNTGGIGWVKHIQPSNFSGPAIIFENEQRHLVDDISYAGNNSWKLDSFKYLTLYGQQGPVNIDLGDAIVRFTKDSDGKLSSSNLVNATLNEDVSGVRTPEMYWEFKNAKGETLYFNKQGLLTIEYNKGGLAHYYTWNGDPKSPYSPTTVTISDDFSNSATIKLSVGNTITSVELSNGITITYGYDKYANLSTVTKSIPTDPDTPSALIELTKTYHYENIAFPYALTGITDEKGVRYATWTYDEIGRVIESKHANNVDKGSISYELNTTTVTNSLGKQTIYHYDMVSGAKRLVKVEGVATPSCSAANQAYTYHPTGRVKTQTDWEGNVTYFEYNIKGQLTKRTEGYGTPDAYTVETTWHEALNEPSVITHPDKQEQFKYNTQGKLINKSVTAL